MAEKREYDFQGRKVPGQEIEFETEKEGWNIYKLADGTRVKLKSVVASIIRLDEYDPLGNPLYLVNAAPAVIVDVPPKLKKKPK
ncbi:MAG: hypothetical protein ABR911_11640 [Syntrophales bacterium]|jgi:hypothetical protein